MRREIEEAVAFACQRQATAWGALIMDDNEHLSQITEAPENWFAVYRQDQGERRVRLAALSTRQTGTMARTANQRAGDEAQDGQTHEIVTHDEYFHLEPCGVRVTGKPTFAQWQQFMYALSVADGSIHWWIGDAVNYGEAAYGEKYAQALDETRFAYQTLRDDAWVAQQFEMSRRRDSLSFSHHKEVAGLAPEQQDALLDEAEKNDWSKQELRQQVRALSHEDTPPLPEGTYRVLYADPPWQYSDKLIDGYGAAEHHYPCLSVEELADLHDDSGRAVRDVAAPDAVLFLWVTSPLLFDAKTIIDAWGFTYKTSFVWDKVKHNYGHYNSVRHEFLLLCTRGSCVPESNKLFDSVVTVERTAEHSKKPEEFYRIIEDLWPVTEPPRHLELFARKARPSWDHWGNQI